MIIFRSFRRFLQQLQPLALQISRQREANSTGIGSSVKPKNQKKMTDVFELLSTPCIASSIYRRTSTTKSAKTPNHPHAKERHHDNSQQSRKTDSDLGEQGKRKSRLTFEIERITASNAPSKDGVPGPVRTANLPLRRGMLYPIELLGQMKTTNLNGPAIDGVHLNGQG